jgi:hypothetical protein
LFVAFPGFVELEMGHRRVTCVLRRTRGLIVILPHVKR